MTARSRPVIGSLREWAVSVFNLLRATYQNWRSDRAIRMGAGLAYYALFAAVPLISSALAVAGLVFSQSQMEAFLVDSLEVLLTDVSVDLRNLTNTFVETIDRNATIGSLGIVGLISGVFAASLLFVALQDSLNTIWDIPVESGIRQSIRRRALAFGIVLLSGLALIASLAVQAIALVVDEVFSSELEALDVFSNLFVTATTWAVAVAALGLLFQLLTRDHLAWRHVFITAAITAVLLVVGTWATGIYFSNFGATTLTGVSGGVLVVLLWFYYLAQIFIAGAELLKTMDERSRDSVLG